MKKHPRFPAALLASALFLAAPGAAGAQGAAEPDLFAFSEGGRLVQFPDDTQISQMDSSPLNIIDGSATTDWTGQASPAPVFVLELAERTELSRVVFDTSPLNRDEKAVRAITVEVSDSSATSGFTQVLSVSLKALKNDQSFSFDPEHLPVGRWVRLTVVDNYGGDDYSAFTGFRGYGRQLTAGAKMANVTGSYQGNSGWGEISLTQQGDQVSGCYEYQQGKVTGTIEGRTMTLDMLETSSDGSTTRHRGYFDMSSDGKMLFGIGRDTDSGLIGYFDYYGAERTSARAGSCG